MSLEIVRVVFIEVRGNVFGLLELEEPSLVLIQQYLHQVFDLPDLLQDVEHIEFLIQLVFALLVEEKLAFGDALPEGGELPTDLAAEHPLEDAHRLELEIGRILSARDNIDLILDLLYT